MGREIPIKFLTGKPENPEDAHPSSTQQPSGDTSPHGQGHPNDHHITADEIQHTAAEKFYWKEQLRLAEELNRITERLNCITIWGIVATFLSLALLWGTLIVTIENAQDDKRAWVGVGEIQILGKPIGEQALSIRAGVKNSGESPAVHAFVHGHLSLLKSAFGDMRIPLSEHPELGNCKGPKLSWSNTLGGTTIVPGSDAMSIGRVSQALPEKFIEIVTMRLRLDLSSQDLARFPTAPNAPPETKDWEVGLYFVGCVNYFDTFRKAHRTSFCYKYVYDRALEATMPNGAFMNCARGNDAD
jgi:hypothetical protein